MKKNLALFVALLCINHTGQSDLRGYELRMYLSTAWFTGLQLGPIVHRHFYNKWFTEPQEKLEKKRDFYERSIYTLKYMTQSTDFMLGNIKFLNVREAKLLVPDSHKDKGRLWEQYIDCFDFAKVKLANEQQKKIKRMFRYNDDYYVEHKQCRFKSCKVLKDQKAIAEFKDSGCPGAPCLKELKKELEEVSEAAIPVWQAEEKVYAQKLEVINEAQRRHDRKSNLFWGTAIVASVVYLGTQIYSLRRNR